MKNASSLPTRAEWSSCAEAFFIVERVAFPLPERTFTLRKCAESFRIYRPTRRCKKTFRARSAPSNLSENFSAMLRGGKVKTFRLPNVGRKKVNKAINIESVFDKFERSRKQKNDEFDAIERKVAQRRHSSSGNSFFRPATNFFFVALRSRGAEAADKWWMNGVL